MSKKPSSKPQTQYVAKVRYSNNLPPPSCPAKLLDDASLIRKDEFRNILSSYFRKEHFRNLIRLNEDLGMTMNLLEMSDAEGIYGLNNNGVPLSLHPLDQILLTDPTKKIATKSENVGFLRRTQYISSDQSSIPQQALDNLKMRKEEDFNPKSLLKSVEDTFEDIEELSSLKHPTRKHLKAKKVWNFLPDSSMFDETFVDVKFLSSASISKNSKADGIKSINDPKLLTAILKEIELNKSTKLISLYATSSETDAQNVKSLLADTTENAPIAEADAANADERNKFLYRKHRDYAGSMEPIEPLRQLAMTFDEKSNVAYYVPVNHKVELRKSRVDPDLIPKLKKVSFGLIELDVREPTFVELGQRDRSRSTFDPMEFGVEEEETEKTQELLNDTEQDQEQT